MKLLKIYKVFYLFLTLNICIPFGGLAQDIYWTEINSGLSGNNQFDNITTNFADHIFACSWYGEGLFRSINNGDGWLLLNSGLPNNIKVGQVGISYNGTVFFGGRAGESGTGTNDFGLGIYRSTNNGTSWSQTSLSHGTAQTIATNSTGDIFTGMMAIPEYYSFRGIHRSTDNGNTWTHVADNNTIYYVTKIAIASNGDIYAGTYQDGLYKSIDNGDTWSLLNSGLIRIWDIVFNSAGDIFVACGNSGVFRSTNHGANWSIINNGLPGLNTVSLTINSNDDVFVGVFLEGLFRSTDNGNSWSVVNNGLTNFKPWCLAINSQDQIFNATDGGGIFRSSQTITNVNELSGKNEISFEINNNYIDSYNTISIIRYNLQKSDFITIKVFNQFGHEVSTIVNQEQDSGNYSVDYDMSFLPNGVYLCRMITGSFSSTKKIVKTH